MITWLAARWPTLESNHHLHFTKLERRPNVIILSRVRMFSRTIYTSAICSARPRTTPFIKKFPVTLRLQYPSLDAPGLAEFSSAEDITAFLSTAKQFLIEPITGQMIRPHQVDKIDPDVIYDVVGSGLPYCEKGLSREQERDRVFKRNAALALKEALENEDPKVMKLPRLIKAEAGRHVNDWEALYRLSDGGFVFLETKYSMSKVSSKYLQLKLTRLNCIRPTSIANRNASPKASLLWKKGKRLGVRNCIWQHIIGLRTKIVSHTRVTKDMESYSRMGQT